MLLSLYKHVYLSVTKKHPVSSDIILTENVRFKNELKPNIFGEFYSPENLLFFQWYIIGKNRLTKLSQSCITIWDIGTMAESDIPTSNFQLPPSTFNPNSSSVRISSDAVHPYHASYPHWDARPRAIMWAILCSLGVVHVGHVIFQ